MEFMRAEMLMELAKREKEAGIIPEGDVDVFMKVSSSYFTNQPGVNVHFHWENLWKYAVRNFALHHAKFQSSSSCNYMHLEIELKL